MMVSETVLTNSKTCHLCSNGDPVPILYAVGCQQPDSSLKCSVEIRRPIYNAVSFLDQRNRVWGSKFKDYIKEIIFFVSKQIKTVKSEYKTTIRSKT